MWLIVQSTDIPNDGTDAKVEGLARIIVIPY